MHIRYVLISFLVPFISAFPTNGWEKGSNIDPDTSVHFRIALFQQNLDKLEKTFWAVSDPNNPKYKEYMTIAQITDLISPRLIHIVRLQQWLNCTDNQKYINPIKATQGSDDVVCQLGINQDYMFVTMASWRAVNLFELGSLFRYTHTSAPAHIHIIRTLPNVVVKIPESLHDVIKYVSGLTGFPPYARRTVRSTNGEPGEDITPQILWKKYNLTGNPSKGSQSVAEFEDAEVQLADVTNFQNLYDIPQQKFDIIGPNNGGYFAECTLDVEFMMGVAPGVPTTMWSVAWTTFETDLLTWTQQVLAAKNPPLIHSVSWGSGEHGYFNYDPKTMMSTNVDFQKMGAAGMSIFVATGDEGTGKSGGPFKKCTRFDAGWPAVSPYVTAVGGTWIEPVSDTEVGWVASGGGFSDVFKRPSYQDAAIKSYLANNASGNLPPFSFYNVSGRGIPDISAASTNYQIVLSNVTYPVSGTSAAAPTVAAIFSRINDILIKDGKKPVGFVNPSLYSLNHVGYDVISGINPYGKCLMGFGAVAGWDAVTGLGTPDYPTLLKHFTKV